MDGVGIVAVVIIPIRTPMAVTLSSIARAGTMTMPVVIVRPVSISIRSIRTVRTLTPTAAVDRMSQTGITRRIPTLDGGASIIGGGGTHR